MTGGQFYIVFLFLQWFCFAVDRERRYRAESGARSTYSLYLLSQQWTMMSSVLLGENPYVRVFMCNSKRINNIFQFSKIIEVFLVLIDNHIQCDYTDTWYILPAEEMKTILVFSFFHKVKRYGFDILFPKWAETQSWPLDFWPHHVTLGSHVSSFSGFPFEIMTRCAPKFRNHRHHRKFNCLLILSSQEHTN